MKPAPDTLLACIDEQAGALREFILLLKEESTLLLGSAASEPLEAMTRRKTRSAARLADLDQARCEGLAQLGFAADRGGVDAAMRAWPQLRVGFEALLELAAQAASLNQKNGQIIRVFLDSNQRALDTLKTLQGENLYDARGRLAR